MDLIAHTHILTPISLPYNRDIYSDISIFFQLETPPKYFDDWFSSVVIEFYRNGKNFSDEEKFPLPCVYRWIRGSCVPRPMQIALICEIIADKSYEQISSDTDIGYEMVYALICMEVMNLLKRTKK